MEQGKIKKVSILKIRRIHQRNIRLNFQEKSQMLLFGSPASTILFEAWHQIKSFDKIIGFVGEFEPGSHGFAVNRDHKSLYI